MAVDTFTASSTSDKLWDNPANWSAGLPTSASDVVINSDVTIVAADPAYVVNSLTLASSPSASSFFQSLTDYGSLTVSGSITLASSSSIYVSGSGTLATATASGVGGTSGMISHITVGSSTSSTPFITVGRLQGAVSVDYRPPGQFGVLASSPTSTIEIDGGTTIITDTASYAGLLEDEFGYRSSAIVLPNVPYQAGETVSFPTPPPNAFGPGGPFDNNTPVQLTLLSQNGQPIFTFNQVNAHGTVFSGPGQPFNTGNLQTQVAPSGAGTLLTFLASGNPLPCYAAGTCILTPDGETSVEALRIGDLIVTQSGAHRSIRWIGRRSFASRFLANNPKVQPIRFQAGSLGGGLPRRDLLVSPEHAMALDGALVPARCLLNGRTIVQETGLERIDYYHIELDSHDVLLAEGAPSESYADASDGGRGIFHNAAEHALLYPGAPSGPAQFCLPRVEHGEALDTLRRMLAARTQPALAPLQGRIDEATHTTIAGWAYDGTGPVTLRLTANGVTLGATVADQPRPDLIAAGIGDGGHAYRFTIPGGLSPALAHDIQVERAQDGQTLPGSPITLAAIPGAQPVPQAIPTAPLAILRGQVDGCTPDRLWGWAWDPSSPHEPVTLQILDNGALAGRVTANMHRPDLETAGIGRGWHSFDVKLPGGLAPLTRHVIELRRETDGADLPGSPVVIEPATTFDAALEQALAMAVSSLPSGPAQHRVLSFFAAQAEQLRRGPPESSRPLAVVITNRLDPAAPCVSHARALQALGYDPSLAAADDMHQPGPATLPGLEGLTLCRAPAQTSVEDVLRSQARRIGLVYLDGTAIAQRYAGLVRFHASAARLIYRAGLLSGPNAQAESSLAGSFDATLTQTEADACVLRQRDPDANVRWGGWHVPTQTPALAFAERSGVAFVGSFGTTADALAAAWLVETVMPLVWQRCPGLPCRLASPLMPDWMRRLADYGVAVTATAGEAVGQARLAVAPLRSPAGWHQSILASLPNGLPCAMTGSAAAGLPLSRSLRAHVADDAAGLADVIIRLHTDEALNAVASKQGRTLIARTFTASAATSALAGALGTRRARPPETMDALTQAC